MAEQLGRQGSSIYGKYSGASSSHESSSTINKDSPIQNQDKSPLLDTSPDLKKIQIPMWLKE